MIDTFKYNNKISIMGILNLTPDSFYDGGKWNIQPEIQSKIEKWVELGVDIIDVGCESSRPGSKPISINEEINRLEIIIPIIKLFPDTIFSIDTNKPKVANYALKNGFQIINDIFGGSVEMLEIAKKNNSPIIIMHMLGNPTNMQINPVYENIVEEIGTFFNNKIIQAQNIGLSKNQLILDPGIGFGKSINDNDIILKNISSFNHFGCPLLIGTSRKSFLNINDNPVSRLSNSISSFTIAVLNGANIIRVHDVKESIKVKKFLERFKQNTTLEIV
jgi:dihydropteroate synthase